MKREIEYRWRVREFMARHGIRNTRELVGPLRERGITLSESQIYRLVSQNPERIYRASNVEYSMMGVSVAGPGSKWP